MTRDEIIRMALEADPFGVDGRLYAMSQLTPETLERFAELVAAAEREACAKVAEWQPCESRTPQRIADAIRARSTP